MAVPTGPTLRVARIAPFTDATHPFSVTVQVINAGEVALEGARIRVTARARVGNRSELREALDRGSRTAQSGSVEEPLPETVPPGGQETVVVERPPASLGMTRSGVYPIEIELRGGQQTATLRTAVPHLTSAPKDRISVAWVLRVERPSVVPVEGIYPEDALDRLSLGELAQQAEAIAARPTQITLAISGALMDTVADLADGFGRRTPSGIEALGADSEPARLAATALSALRRAAAAVGEIAGAPYAPASLPSLAARGLGGDILRQVTLGRSAVEAGSGRAPSPAVFAPTDGQLSDAALGAVAGLGAGVALVDPRALTAAPTEPFRAKDFGPSRPVALRVADERAFTALLPDAPLTERLEAAEQSVLLGQALVAESASSWHELPLFAGERVLVVTSRRLPAPTVLRAALDGFAEAPWVSLRTMSGAATALPPREPPTGVRSFAPGDAEHLRAARAARRALTTLEAILAGPLPAAETYERQILVAESSEWYRDPAAGAAIGRSVGTQVRSALGRIVVTRERRVTLTARSGEVPVTIVNGNDFPVAVRVRVLSPRLGFPRGDAHVVAPFTGNTTVDVPVVARATGSYQVDVRIETPDGRRTLASGKVVLRTTAVSSVTLLAVGGGALLLLFSGMRPGRRRRRRRDATATDGAGASDAETPERPRRGFMRLVRSTR